jgi:hypothetical protein
VERLRNPAQTPLVLDDPDEILSLELFVALSRSSQTAYGDARAAMLRRHPEDKILSYQQCEKRLAEVTGIYPTKYDMCVNSCSAFVGPWKDRTHCIECGQPRYGESVVRGKTRQVPRLQLIHTPLALQLQALHRSVQGSLAAQYWAQKMQQLKEELGPQLDGLPDNLEDIFHGEALLRAIRDGLIGPDDTVVCSTMDGAQLYMSKQSDCWFVVWIVFRLGPDKRYKKKHVIVDTIVPGKNKPVHMFSFMFVTLQIIAALMRMNDGKGMPMWSAAEKRLFLTRLFLALNLADAPGMATVNGLVGHTGARGCRLLCDLIGRRKPGSGTYYPALLRPANYTVRGCTHGNVNPGEIKLITEAEYRAALERIERAASQAEYDSVRKDTGVSKPSIFSGLPKRNTLGMPDIDTLDNMHIFSANLVLLVNDLWCGTITCADTDDKASWPWYVLHGQVWEEHGARVEACHSRLPSSHDIAPRNPAEKLHSAYKAKEHQTHTYVLCPGLLLGVLPLVYWVHFMKLVAAVRVLHLPVIKRAELLRAHRLLLEFCVEFEVLYVQFRVDRLHFVRPCMHTLVHMAPETFRVGPLRNVSQWTMERTIGVLTQEIRQDSNAFMNLSYQALRMSQMNALKILLPELDVDQRREDAVAAMGQHCGDGFVLLPEYERTAHAVCAEETRAIEAFVCEQAGTQWTSKKVRRWGRARLPNQQIVRSLWKEEHGAADLRAASSLRVCAWDLTCLQPADLAGADSPQRTHYVRGGAVSGRTPRRRRQGDPCSDCAAVRAFYKPPLHHLLWRAAGLFPTHARASADCGSSHQHRVSHRHV